MKKIICNSIEFVFVSEIQYKINGKFILKSGREWEKLDVTEKPVYSSETKQANPGPVKEETVTAITRYDEDAILKTHSNFPIILRMKTIADDTFYVGSILYPIITEVSCDKIFDTYTFKSKSTP